MKSFAIFSSLLCLLHPETATSFVLPTRIATSGARVIPTSVVAGPSTTGTATSTSSTTRLEALPAVATTALASLAALPLSQKIVLSCFVPTCLGFWKSEYGVSYAYGTATALTSYWIAKAFLLTAPVVAVKATKKAALTAATSTPGWPLWHAGALMFYGIRLCLFLAYRESFSKRMKESVERIEARAKERGGRLKRAPFVLSCAGLYFGLCAPLLITSQIMTTTAATTWLIPQPWMTRICQSLVGMTWFGFVFAALGDLNKSLVKAMKGEDHLVTGGIFGVCRHPNYTGEIIGWTCNGLLAIFAAIATKGAAGIIPLPQLVGYLFASIAGAVGLDFVLFQATGGLEKRQKEKYGDTEEYKSWVDTTWAGFEMPAKVEKVAEEVSSVNPEIEVVETEEKGGSGI